MAREGIHPKYYEATFECTTCGTKFMSGSTKGLDIKVDTCSSCHPFYVGKNKFANAAGRIERFNSKFAKKDEITKQVEDQSKQQKEINKKDAKTK